MRVEVAAQVVQGLLVVVREQPVVVERVLFDGRRDDPTDQDHVVADLELFFEAALDPADAAFEQHGVEAAGAESRQLRQLQLVDVGAA